MLREEMKERAIAEEERIYSHSRSLTMNFIDEIYDSFESRTCSSCKHNSDYGCINSSWKVSCSSDGAEYHFVEDDFGCNQWEAKE